MIGSVQMWKGQRYECVGLEPYTKKTGERTAIPVWRSHCAECGVEMTTKAPAPDGVLVYPCRRCPDHRRPGVSPGARAESRRRHRRRTDHG